MKKFTWGTGIFLFLVLFLAGSAVFIIFASRQTVNLVHKDYYEKGVDYSEEIRVKARSKEFQDALDIQLTNEALQIVIDSMVAAKIDSGSMYLYRPSDSRRDINFTMEPQTKQVAFRRSDLSNGRYILKFTWYTKGIKYQVQQPVNVQ
ncbi:MAG: FixH family protein [Draconibacterium sp.]